MKNPYVKPELWHLKNIKKENLYDVRSADDVLDENIKNHES